MIITQEEAEKAIANGTALKTSIVTDPEGREYMSVDRYDLRRVDHYEIKRR